MAWAAVAGAAIGAVGSSMGSGGGGGGGGTSSTATKEPWAEAAPWLKQQIADGQTLQSFYQQNPLNSQQMTGYANQFEDLDNLRNNITPTLFNLSNNLLQSNYRRGNSGQSGPTTTQPTSASTGTGLFQSQGQQAPSQSSGATGLFQPAGAAGQVTNGPQNQIPQGLFRTNMGGAAYGLQTPQTLSVDPIGMAAAAAPAADPASTVAQGSTLDPELQSVLAAYGDKVPKGMSDSELKDWLRVRVPNFWNGER